LNNKGVTIHGYDGFKPLVDFWQNVIDNPGTLARIIKTYYPLSKEEFYKLQKEHCKENQDKILNGAIYYVLNRCSFSGSTLSGGMSPSHPRYTESGISKILNSRFENFHVDYADFKESFKKRKNMLAYIDPPYMIKNNLYGIKGDLHKSFNHMELHEILKARDNWILSYNDCEAVRELYKEFKIVSLDWKYGMSKDKKSSEILILNV
jgi:DNA adenine methylase